MEISWKTVCRRDDRFSAWKVHLAAQCWLESLQGVARLEEHRERRIERDHSMKILFITSALGIDYLSDCVFHGLVQSGHDVLDSKYLWYLSKPLTHEQ